MELLLETTFLLGKAKFDDVSLKDQAEAAIERVYGDPEVVAYLERKHVPCNS